MRPEEAIGLAILVGRQQNAIVFLEGRIVELEEKLAETTERATARPTVSDNPDR